MARPRKVQRGCCTTCLGVVPQEAAWPLVRSKWRGQVAQAVSRSLKPHTTKVQELQGVLMQRTIMQPLHQHLLATSFLREGLLRWLLKETQCSMVVPPHRPTSDTTTIPTTMQPLSQPMPLLQAP